MRKIHAEVFRLPTGWSLAGCGEQTMFASIDPNEVTCKSLGCRAKIKDWQTAILYVQRLEARRANSLK